MIQGVLFSSCTRNVCPAYLSSFQPQRGAPNQFFAYFKPEGEGETESTEDVYADDSFLAPSFEEDTLALAKEDTFKNSYGLLVFANGEEPMESKLMKNTVRNKNGIVKKSNFITRIFSNPKKRRNANYPKVVSTKNPRPFKVEEAEEDSTHQLVQKKEPPKNSDQWYYEMQFGNPDAVDSTNVEEQNAGDSLATETTEENLENLSKKERRKKRKEERKEKKRKRKNKKGDADLKEDDEMITDDSFTEYVGEESLKEKKKKKKKKNADKEKTDESTLDDT